MITNASISHYKSLGEVNIELGAINVFVGPNGSGKSNILDAISFLHDCAVEGIDVAITKRHGIDSLRQWSRTSPYNIAIGLKFRRGLETGSYNLVIASHKGDYKIIQETGDWAGIHQNISPRSPSGLFMYTFNRQRNSYIINNVGIDGKPGLKFEINSENLLITTLKNRINIPSLTIFDRIVSELASFSRYNIYPNSLKIPQIVSRDTTLAEDGANLASVLKVINASKREAAAKEEIISALQVIMPSVVDFIVRSAGGYYVPVLRVREDNGDAHDFNLAQISDGTLRTLGLLCAFYQPSAPDKIGIEEPEQMIHPGALPVVHEAINDFVSAEDKPGRQVFITTHSPTLLDFFKPEEIIWTQLRKGVTECGRVQPRQLAIIKEKLFTAGELLLAEGIF